jgi:hypothetical protein
MIDAKTWDRWHSLTLSPADRAILDQMEEEMRKPDAATKQSIGNCPSCGVIGPWLVGSVGLQCGNCGRLHPKQPRRI